MIESIGTGAQLRVRNTKRGDEGGGWRGGERRRRDRDYQRIVHGREGRERRGRAGKRS